MICNLIYKKTKLSLSDHVFVAPADPIPEGTVTGNVSGDAASTHDSGHTTGVRSAWKRECGDSGHSAGVRSAWKRKRVDRGTYNSST